MSLHNPKRNIKSMKYPNYPGVKLVWTFVIIVDYLTDFFEVSNLSNTLASTIVQDAKW